MEGVTLLRDPAVELDAVEPLRQEDRLLVAEGPAKECVVASLAGVAVAKDDQGARIPSFEFGQGRGVVQDLFPDRSRVVPSDPKAFFTRVETPEGQGRTPPGSSGSTSRGSARAATGRDATGAASTSASLGDGPGGGPHDGHRAGQDTDP